MSQELKEALESLADCLGQGCISIDSGKYKGKFQTAGLSAYAHAVFVLEKHKMVKIFDGVGRVRIFEFIESEGK